MLTMVMLARIMLEEMKSIVLILVRKKLLPACLFFLQLHRLRIPATIRKMYENDVKTAMTLVFGLEMTMVSTSLM